MERCFDEAWFTGLASCRRAAEISGSARHVQLHLWPHADDDARRVLDETFALGPEAQQAEACGQHPGEDAPPDNGHGT